MGDYVPEEQVPIPNRRFGGSAQGLGEPSQECQVLPLIQAVEVVSLTHSHMPSALNAYCPDIWSDGQPVNDVQACLSSLPLSFSVN